MLEIFKRMFESRADYCSLVKRGATILDVRTTGEYASGHVKGAINIPLDQLTHNLDKIRKDLPVIACCASGMRSATAKAILKSKGFEVYNGGSWLKLNVAIVK